MLGIGLRHRWNSGTGTGRMYGTSLFRRFEVRFLTGGFDIRLGHLQLPRGPISIGHLDVPDPPFEAAFDMVRIAVRVSECRRSRYIFAHMLTTMFLS